MFSKEEQRFIDQFKQFTEELESLDAQIEAIEARREVLTKLLFGDFMVDETESVEAPEDVAVPLSIEEKRNVVVNFLGMVPNSKRSDIVAAFPEIADDIKRILEWGKRHEVLINEGKGRGSVWSVA